MRSLGVNGCGVVQLEPLAGGGGRVPPAVNLVSLSPFNQRRELMQYCRARGVVLLARAPLGSAPQQANPTLTALAQRLGVTPAQLLIRWSLQQGCVPLPDDCDPQHQSQNFRVFNFMIPDAEMGVLSRLANTMLEQEGPEMGAGADR